MILEFAIVTTSTLSTASQTANTGGHRRPSYGIAVVAKAPAGFPTHQAFIEYYDAGPAPGFPITRPVCGATQSYLGRVAN
jgi:hypothetical protein